MIEPHFAGIAHNPQHYRISRLSSAISNGLPAVVIEIAQAFKAAQHWGTRLIIVLMYLGQRCVWGDQKQEHRRQQRNQKPTQHTHLNKPIHGAIINAPCLDCGNRRPEMKTAQLTIREEGRKDAKAKLIINR
jgi:hypothetical protein